MQFKPPQSASKTYTPNYWTLCSTIGASLTANPFAASSFRSFARISPTICCCCRWGSDKVELWPSAIQSPSQPEGLVWMFSSLSLAQFAPLLCLCRHESNSFSHYISVSDFITQWDRWCAISSGYYLHSAISYRTVSAGPGPSHCPQASPLCTETPRSDFHTTVYLCGVTASLQTKVSLYSKPQQPGASPDERRFCFCRTTTSSHTAVLLGVS